MRRGAPLDLEQAGSGPRDVAHQQGSDGSPGRERHVLCLDGKRRMVADPDLSFRVGAMHLDAQRKSADGLRPGIDAAPAASRSIQPAKVRSATAAE